MKNARDLSKDKAFMFRGNAFANAFAAAGVVNTTRGPLHMDVVDVPMQRIARVSYPLNVKR